MSVRLPGYQDAVLTCPTFYFKSPYDQLKTLHSSFIHFFNKACVCVCTLCTCAMFSNPLWPRSFASAIVCTAFIFGQNPLLSLSRGLLPARFSPCLRTNRPEKRLTRLVAMLVLRTTHRIHAYAHRHTVKHVGSVVGVKPTLVWFMMEQSEFRFGDESRELPHTFRNLLPLVWSLQTHAHTRQKMCNRPRNV